MTMIKNNPLLKGASGMLGDVIVYRESRGQIIMANRPKRSGKRTANQEAVSDRFLEAVQYAKMKVADPEQKAEYQAVVNERVNSAYAAAVNDYLKAPVVKEVRLKRYKGNVGDVIVVKAVDDFKVTGVFVEIVSATGTALESGNAVLQEASVFEWTFTAATANAALPGTQVIVSATDKAGNETRTETVIA